MLFASPLWLIGLLPWAAAVIWLLLGRRERVVVPFVQLWRGPTPSPRAKPSLVRPPLAILLAILALLCAVLASARPGIPSRDGVPLTIIVDRGITLSARGERIERFKETCSALATRLLDQAANGPVQLICVPGGQAQQLNRTTWNSAVATTPISLQQSQPQLDATVRHLLASGASNIVVVSDQPIAPDARILQIEPEHAASNLTIADVAARATPYAQVMVQLRDQNCTADSRPAIVRVESAGHIASQKVQVPRNGVATAFIDLPSLGPTVSVNIDAPDDLHADNLAWLAHEQHSAIIESSPTLPASLQRMIAVYNRHRSGGGRRIAVVTNPADAAPEQPSVVISRGDLPLLQTGELHVESHPIAAKVDWAAAISDFGGSPQPPGYRPIVSDGIDAFVAVRESPARSVWTDLPETNWPTKPDYVIFWTNVFDWLGGEDVYRWYPLDRDDKPGIEKQSDGTLRAFNAINVRFPPIRPNDWTRLRGLNHSTKNASDLTAASCAAALLLMVSAIFAMPYLRSQDEVAAVSR
jgi:hypothetical protein